MTYMSALQIARHQIHLMFLTASIVDPVAASTVTQDTPRCMKHGPSVARQLNVDLSCSTAITITIYAELLIRKIQILSDIFIQRIAVLLQISKSYQFAIFPRCINIYQYKNEHKNRIDNISFQPKRLRLLPPQVRVNTYFT